MSPVITLSSEAMLVFKVNGRDLAPFLRTQKEAGFDPAGFDYLDPQFVGNAAVREGQAFVADAIRNREFVAPLILRADTTAALHKLIADINGDLFAGAQVEFQMHGSDEPTFFDLERGRLEQEFEYWIARAGWMRVALRLWCRPFGNTGTARTVASLSAAGPTYFPVTGILGDVDALAKVEVRVGSKVASGGRVVGYGVHRSASFLPYRGPSSADFVAQSGATVRGASGAIGSQYVAIPVSPTGASGVALTSFLTPPAGHAGRHRVFGVMRSGLDQPITLHARDRFGAPLGPTTAASVTDQTRWGLVDLGETQVPERDARQEAVPTQLVELIGGGASGAQINASPALQLNRLIYLPLDEAPGLLRTRGPANSLVYGDSFHRLVALPLDDVPNVEQGDAVWAPVNSAGARRLGALLDVNNDLAVFRALGPIATYVNLLGGAQAGVKGANATGYYSLGSGAQYHDVVAEVRTGLFPGGSASLENSVIELWPKARAASQGPRVKLQLGPSANHHIALFRSEVLMASAALGASTASSFALGHRHRLVAQLNGGGFDVWLATGALGPTPIISASHANLTVPGWPQLAMQAGSDVASAVIVADDFSYRSLAGGASDIGAREYFRFESHPERRTFQGNASVMVADRVAEFRGPPPRLPAVGSPGASGPAQVVAFAGDPSDFLGNDVMDVRVDVVERFRFLR